MLLEKRFILFLLVGGFNTAFSYSIYAFFLFIGLNYAFANLLALATGILLSFKTQGVFVFKNPDNRLLGRFLVCWALIYMGNIFFIKKMLTLGLNAYVAGVLAIPPVVVFSYLTQKFIVFRRTEPPTCSSVQLQDQDITNASERSQ
jgi:putative flippase GtrA